MTESEFKARTKDIGIRVVNALPRTAAADVIGRQLLRCGMSVGANHRAACRGRSRAEVIAKLGVVEEEADETLYWLELLIEAGLIAKPKPAPLMKEVDGIIAMVAASIRTLRTGGGTIQNRQSGIQNENGRR